MRLWHRCGIFVGVWETGKSDIYSMEKSDYGGLPQLAAMIRQVSDDIMDIAASGQYPIVTMLRGYDLLEALSEEESVKYQLQNCGAEGSGAKEFREAVAHYKEVCLANGEKLYAVIDMEQVQMKAAAYLGPWGKRYKEAKEAFEKAEELHLMAKVAHKAQEEGGFFEKWKTLRQVRKMAGFPLERKRTGNFVARTFDLMEEARMKMREAELKMYGHNVAYKCTPDTYMKIFELLSKKYTG